MNNQKGATATEYGLLGALISILIISAVTITGLNVKQVFCVIASDLATVVGGEKGDCAMASNNSNDGSSDNTSSETQIQKLEAEGLDASFIPEEEGGTAGVATGVNPLTNAFHSNAIMGVMEKLEAIDPITSIYGLYSYDTNSVTGVRTNYQPITTYEDALDFETDSYTDPTTKISEGGDVWGDGGGFALTETPAENIVNSSKNSSPINMAQVTTQSGATYNITWQYKPGNASIEISKAVNVATGATVATTTMSTAYPDNGGSRVDLVDKTVYNVAQ